MHKLDYFSIFETLNINIRQALILTTCKELNHLLKINYCTIIIANKIEIILRKKYIVNFNAQYRLSFLIK